MAGIADAAKKLVAWVGAALLAAGLAFLAFLRLRPRPSPETSAGGSGAAEGAPEASPATTAAVASTEAQAAASKQSATAIAATTSSELHTIAKEEDGAKRRKNVALLLRKP